MSDIINSLAGMTDTDTVRLTFNICRCWIFSHTHIEEDH